MKNILHLDRLSNADLGKFSMILSELLTSKQRAALNAEYPAFMETMGAFESSIPQIPGYSVHANTWELAKDAMEAGKKIQAIKEMRAGTGMPLKEAKEYVDIHMQQFFRTL